ncbi:hypothetical protein BST92_09400 [Nonlabens arenilitoris]|uniref:Uncharacterized protein n=1 Tax=Nonlabens arenilitoris TaxID=1217969 RepID=A0A2S7UCJ3_9FLAO|nr:hypothetical protein [Nonlabens arenilitoris]PQJ32124.1 hypothetical protein BST92_09400 [Nonlabens arenilitoris]
MKRFLVLFVLIVVLSCAHRNYSYVQSPSYVLKPGDTLFTFNENAVQGKWLINYPSDKSYVIYKDGYRLNKENNFTKNENQKYVLKMDSIFYFRNSKVYSGKLLFQTYKELKINWGNSETISYYRPKVRVK